MGADEQAASGFRFVDSRICLEMGEMIFEMESEEAAIAALVPTQKGWSRRGHLLIFDASLD